MKYDMAKAFGLAEKVTPLVGVWIEIIDDVVYNDTDSMSLPLWECGLKYQVYFRLSYTYGHSPCGSVD